MATSPAALGECIVSGLKKKRMNQSELAEQCSVTKAHISHIITGRTNPSIQTLSKIICALELESIDIATVLINMEKH